MSDIKVMIQVGMPKPAEEKPAPEAPKKPTVEEKVRYALECIESGFDSHQEWIMLNKLYHDLMNMKNKNDRVQNLIKMIQPTLAKYGYHKVSSED